MKIWALFFILFTLTAFPQDQTEEATVESLAPTENSSEIPAEPSQAPEETPVSNEETLNSPETSIESAPVPDEAMATPTETPAAQTDTGPTLVVARGSGNIPPFEWENENGIQGIHIDLVKSVGKKLGFNVQFETVPWKRAIIKMQVKGADAITYVSKTVDREDFIYFFEGNIISKTNVHFFTIDKTEKKEKMTFWKIRSFKDFKDWISGAEPPPYEPINIDRSIYNLKGYKFGVQKGYTYGDEFENVEGINKIFAGTIYDLKNSLLSGEADIGVVDIDYFANLFQDEDFFKRVRFSKDPYYVSMNYIGFSKKPQNLEIAKKFSEGMIEFKKTQEYKDLLLKYNFKNP